MIKGSVNIINDKIAFHKGPLSNWYYCEFTTVEDGEEMTWLSSEQYFMWLKARHFNDYSSACKIYACTTPKEAKDLGRHVKNFDVNVWDKICEDYMYIACLAKFKTPEMKKFISDRMFDNRHFVEGSKTDKIWGVGIDWTDNSIGDENNWLGTNLLGKCLDKVRNTIITSPASHKTS